PRILFFDCKASSRTIPQSLMTVLTKGTQIQLVTDEAPYSLDVPPLLESDCTFHSFSHLNQQSNSHDCGWWALYNASAALLHGNGLFYEQLFSGQASEAGNNQAGQFLRVYCRYLLEKGEKSFAKKRKADHVLTPDQLAEFKEIQSKKK